MGLRLWVQNLNPKSMSQFHMGINMGHDRSVAIVKDGEILVAIEQERLDRQKHSVGFMLQSPDALNQIQIPEESVAYCLDALGITMDDIGTVTANMPGVDHASDILKGRYTKAMAGKVRTIPSHHLAHAYSAFLPSGMDCALVLVADASGSTFNTDEGRFTESFTLYLGEGSTLTPIHSEKVQSHLAALSTLGFVYEAVSRKAGFVTELNDGLRFPEAGKLMGLAAYGSDQENWFPWMTRSEAGLGIRMSAYDIFLEIEALEKRYDDGKGKPYFRPYLVDLAHKVQTELEKVLCDLVRDALTDTGVKTLCMAGGVALNSVANYKILRACALDDIFIFPAAADNGISAGCALWGYTEAEGAAASRVALRNAYLGNSYGEDAVERAVAAFAGQIVVEDLDAEAMEARVAESLSRGNIVARFEGGAEFGPRALGHRSILADPAFERMKDVVNARVKFREAFRPFAPVIPLDRIDEVFELAHHSPYMLLVAPVREEFRSTLPAITHHDGTGRIQTCTVEQNAFMYGLCNRLAAMRGGAPVLLNTSFNVAGQPIVETPKEAIATFLRTDIDCLALEGKWIRKQHVAIKNYADHTRGLAQEAFPVGLPAGQSGVGDMMADLDRAMMTGAESLYWTAEEVAVLASRGAQFKETSLRFPETPFVAPLVTQFGSYATLVLNPRGGSVLIDETGSTGVEELSMEDVEVILALQQPMNIREEVRLALKASPTEFEQRVTRIIGVAQRFGVSIHGDWTARQAASVQPDVQSNRTFGAFTESIDLLGPLASIRQIFDEAGYCELRVCDRLGVDSMQTIEPTRLRYYDAHLLGEDAQADLIRLFQLRATVPLARLASLFSAKDLALMKDLGMVSILGQEVRGGVDVFCSDGYLFATDHRYMIREEDALDEDPVMYIGMDSHGLVQTAPRTGCEDLLDLCCGSGIQGIVASRYARRVIAVDINPRAIRFTRFNAQFNGVTNHEVRQGSLYDVVEGQRFDAILANPPFVPSPESNLKFRDGEATGESLLRAIVQAGPAHLAPAGRLAIVTDLVDVPTYETKLASWLSGVRGTGTILTTADRDEILFSVPHCHAPFSQSFADYNRELDRWVTNFRQASLEAVNFGYILLWLRPQEGLDLTTRTIHNPTRPMWNDVETWISQCRLKDGAGAADMIVKPRQDLQVSTTEFLDGETAEIQISVAGEPPFFTDYQLRPDMVVEMRKMARLDIPLSRYVGTRDAEWVDALHRIGLLILTNRKPDVLSGKRMREPVIRQRETKTTPTCLSSYLR